MGHQDYKATLQVQRWLIELKGRTIAVYLPHDLLRRLRVLTAEIKGHRSRSAIVAALLYRALGCEIQAAVVLDEIEEFIPF